MTVKFTPASLTVEVPTDTVTLDAETVSALLDGSAGRTARARVSALIAPRTVTITEGTRVRLKVCPEGHSDFDFGMRGWDTDDVTVEHVTAMSVQVRSELAKDFTVYAGPLEKILDVLEVLEDESPETPPVPAADPEGWIKWDFSNPEGPDLLEGQNVQVRLRDGGTTSDAGVVSDFDWEDDDCGGDIVAYRIV